jgi:assimilatory nitrate reductase catalytic subunit
VLASGRLGREGCGYATITGQANGQGGRAAILILASLEV